MRKFLSLLAAITTMCVCGSALAQTEPAAAPAEEPTTTPRVPFYTRGTNTHELGFSFGRAFSVLVCNQTGDNAWVYSFGGVGPEGRKNEKVHMGSCLLLRDIRRFGLSEGSGWQGHAIFYF